MKLMNGKELAHVPNGTVFSDVEWNGSGNGDYKVHSLHIMCGNDDIGDSYFNGVLTMLDWIPIDDGEIARPWVDYGVEDYFDRVYDIDQNDYSEKDWVVVWERKDVEKIIRNLLWALSGCKSGVYRPE